MAPRRRPGRTSTCVNGISAHDSKRPVTRFFQEFIFDSQLCLLSPTFATSTKPTTPISLVFPSILIIIVRRMTPFLSSPRSCFVLALPSLPSRCRSPLPYPHIMTPTSALGRYPTSLCSVVTSLPLVFLSTPLVSLIVTSFVYVYDDARLS